MTHIPEYGKNPVSKRRQLVKRWLIRLGITAAVSVIVIPLSVLIWGWWEGRQLNKEIAALQAAGEPGVAADLEAPPVPDAENSVPDLRAAARIVGNQAALYKKVDDLNGSNGRIGLPLREDERAAIRAALGASPGAFPLVESAAKKPRAVLDLKFKSPILLMLLPELNEQRHLAQALSYAAYEAQSSGDTATALRRVNEMMPIGRFVDQFPNVVGHLVSIGVDALATASAADVAADAGKRNAPLSADARREAQALITRLLDDTESDAGLRRALRGERVMGMDAAQVIAAGKWNNNAGVSIPVSRFPSAFMLRNARGMNWAFSDVLTSLEGANDLQTFQTAYARQPHVIERSPRMYMLGNILMPSVSRAVYVHYRGRADRRLGATALAVMLYRADHGGAYPQTLNDLVSQYLPAVPIDPLASRGATIGYVAEGERPRVYSVGENGIDNGGTPLDPTKSVRENMQVLDQVIDLVPQTRPLPETREADESNDP